MCSPFEIWTGVYVKPKFRDQLYITDPFFFLVEERKIAI